MKQSHELFLCALKAALNGEKLKYVNVSAAVWQDVFKLAEIHSVTPMILDASYSCMKDVNEQWMMQMRRKVRQHIMLQTMKTQEFFQLYEQLRASGCTPLVVKGIILRNLYPQPDHRLSSDEDVLIPAEQFEKCHQIMLEQGMQTDCEDLMKAYEVPYRKDVLYIELHKQLFPKESEAYGDLNRYFETCFEKKQVEKIQEHEIMTMNVNDHFFYLICHSLKHFLHSGFGIRQVCDIVMFANAYGAQMNWNEIYQKASEIHAEVFTAALLKMGKKYLNLDDEKACLSEVWKNMDIDEMDMLMDLLESGVYGGSTMSRKHSSNMTLNAVSKDKQGKKSKVSVVSSLFPNVDQLKSRYSYLKKYPVLLPVAWISRIIKYGKETMNTQNNDAKETLRIGNQRIELLRQYKVIK
ncbi:MAG: nucleotidyltransferase family protein [Erysipelotrichaceae bacterium]|nr:nucleotidyltransferase family protein [Erysipelotrichaceae bacterium]